MKTYYQMLQYYQEQKQPCVSVTQVHVVGSSPQNLGARMIVDASGRLWGTVGGGKIENHCIKHAKRLLREKARFDHQIWNLQTDIGMTCGGVGHFFFETHRVEPWTVVVFGAGHVAQALVPLLTTLPCRVLCFDTRQEWIDRLPDHERLEARVVPVLADVVQHLDPDAFVVSMTMGHAHDVPILHEIFNRQNQEPGVFPYVGVIGSKAKSGAIHRDLRKLGHERETLDRLICPVGLPLGSNEPAEIAISIAAQLLQKRDET